jgi:formate dehydrogenase maturation protein FdhE
MQVVLQTKLRAMLWDMPEHKILEIINKILANPVELFQNDDQIFIKALNSLKWYELIKLIGRQNMVTLLTDSNTQKLFQVQRRT